MRVLHVRPEGTNEQAYIVHFDTRKKLFLLLEVAHFPVTY